MPIYEYKCNCCGHEFEDLRTAGESDDPASCPKCKKSGAKRKMSVFASGSAGHSESAGAGASCGSGGHFG